MNNPVESVVMTAQREARNFCLLTVGYLVVFLSWPITMAATAAGHMWASHTAGHTAWHWGDVFANWPGAPLAAILAYEVIALALVTSDRLGARALTNI